MSILGKNNESSPTGAQLEFRIEYDPYNDTMAVFVEKARWVDREPTSRTILSIDTIPRDIVEKAVLEAKLGRKNAVYSSSDYTLIAVLRDKAPEYDAGTLEEYEKAVQEYAKLCVLTNLLGSVYTYASDEVSRTKKRRDEAYDRVQGLRQSLISPRK